MLSADMGDVVHSIPAPGYYSDGLAWDGDYLWVVNIADANHFDNYWYRIFKISSENGEIIESFSTGSYFHHGLTHDGNNLWSERNYTQIVKLSDNGQVMDQFSAVPLGVGLAYDLENEILFQSATQPGGIYLIDPFTGNQIGELPIPDDIDYGWCDLAFDGTYLWHTNVSTDLIYKINPETGETLASFETPSGQCEGLTFDGHYLWASDTNLDLLYQIDIEFQPSNPCGEWELGDSNLDGNINIQDIILLVNYILGGNVWDDCQLSIMDVNGDSNYDILDMVALVTIILGT